MSYLRQKSILESGTLRGGVCPSEVMTGPIPPIPDAAQAHQASARQTSLSTSCGYSVRAFGERRARESARATEVLS